MPNLKNYIAIGLVTVTLIGLVGCLYHIDTVVTYVMNNIL